MMQRVEGYNSVNALGIVLTTSSFESQILILPREKYKKFDHVIKYLETVDLGILNNQEIKVNVRSDHIHKKLVNR